MKHKKLTLATAILWVVGAAAWWHDTDLFGFFMFMVSCAAAGVNFHRYLEGR